MEFYSRRQTIRQLIMDFLHLIRYKNLLIIILLQFLIRFCIIIPILQLYGITKASMENLDFIFLVLATVFVCASGNIINDYFDVKIDTINRPDKVIIDKKISSQSAKQLFWLFAVMGCVLGFLVASRINNLLFGFLFVFSSGILYFYSLSYKKQFLLGNLIVAFLSGLVPMIPVMFELPILIEDHRNYFIEHQEQINLNILIYWSLAYAVFAFVFTLIREIIKDLEDFEGDNFSDRNTIPVVLGESVSKIIVGSITILAILGLCYVYFSFFGDLVCGLYVGILLILPLIYLVYKIFKIEKKEDCTFLSNCFKIIMIIGIMFLFIAKWMFS